MIIQMEARRAVIDLDALFCSAVEAEESGEKNIAIGLYEQIIENDSGCAPAFVNLGTIFFHSRRLGRAEELYRKATEIDPNYALAFFNLANTLESLDRVPKAIEAYRRAASLDYADSHYNLALLYQRESEDRLALHHWKSYVRFDRDGPWSDFARGQIRILFEREPLQLVKTAPVSSGQLSLWQNRAPFHSPKPCNDTVRLQILETR